MASSGLGSVPRALPRPEGSSRPSLRAPPGLRSRAPPAPLHRGLVRRRAGCPFRPSNGTRLLGRTRRCGGPEAVEGGAGALLP